MLPIEELLTLAVGTASLTAEKAQELLDEVKIKGHLGESEGKEVLQAMLDSGRERKQQAEELVRNALREQLAAAGLCTKGELEQLRGELAALQQAVKALQEKAQEQDNA